MPEKMSPKSHQEILGLPVEPLIETVYSANSLAGIGRKSFLPLGVYRSTLQTGANIWPLVENVQKGRPVRPEDIRPHTDDIIDDIVTNPAVRDAAVRRGDLGTARKLGWLNRLRDVQLVRDRVRPEVEARFPEHVRTFLQSDETKQGVERGLEAAKPYTDVLASYNNPREQFVTELTTMNDEIRERTQMVREARLATEYARRPAHTFRGRLLRWRHRNKTPDQLTTAADAAHGIDHVFRNTLTNETPQTPMLKNIIETALAETGRSASEITPPTSVRKFGITVPTVKILEVAAPEIMQTLEAPLPPERRNAQFLKSIQRLTPRRMLGRLLKGFDLSVLRRRGPQLLTSLRDTLPTSGKKITESMDEIREFFLTA